MIDSKVMLQAVRYSLCSEESPEMTNLSSATLEAIFDADVKATCFPTSFSNVWHLYALASILERNIYSIYPMRNVKIRPYFNRVIRPRRCTHVTSMLHIMWAGQPLTSHLFRHQYFAPVVGLEEMEADGAAALDPSPPIPGPLLPPAKTLELLNREPSLSYSHLCDRSNITKSTFYRWRRQTQEHRQKVATRFSAKHFLQDSFYRGGLVPLQQFLQRFPEISRSTYYAWKHELLGSGAYPALVPATPPSEALIVPELENLPGKKAAEGLGCSPPAVAVSSPSMVLMQRAKSYLEHCISLNKLVPYRCFKSRFPGISRSTYYNWRRKALRRSPSFKLAPALETTESLPPTDVGDAALLSLKGEVGEEGTGKAVGGDPPTSQGPTSTRMPLSRWQRRLRRAARKQVLSGHLSFCRFRLRYPSLLPSTFWVWKSLSRGWPRMRASSVGQRRQEPEEQQKPAEWQEMEAVENKTSVMAPQVETLPVAAFSETPPEHAQGRPREGVIQETAMTQGQPHSGSLSSHAVAAAAGGRDGQVLVMDMLTTTRFKAQAKLFLQKRFQSKTFPSYKEFQSLFPLTARSTYYMWKRALFEGLTLVDG
ncbi:vertnin isoform X2 [Mesocricetus auratus]|nr:vertnin isoform X2 [Mesocricetus auratus]